MMIKRLVYSALFLLQFIDAVFADNSILPQDETYLTGIPAPEHSLGWQVGEWHARPEQITQYFQQLADLSERASLDVIGQSHEQRPLIHLKITSPANQKKLDDLREEHLNGSDLLVIWLGYSIHGNEASGSNAALLLAYHLIAGEADWIQELLENTVIIVDPMFNPDGLARFATWANMHRGQVLTADKQHRSHWEAWPAGRFNHYWFDMNRDWLPVTQPESVARLKQFHRWLPNVLGDFHEQGSDAGYFFQPGVASRKNPLTSIRNVELTTALAAYHAKALDEVGQRYYSRETFDDFYYGKGSTYPDINGSIGILYEQPSSRGHQINSINGDFTFTDAVRNHYATSISTLQGAHAIRTDLITYQKTFFDKAQTAAKKGAWLFADAPQAKDLVAMLKTHQITVYPNGTSVRINDKEYLPGSVWVVPSRQRQARLIEAIFEQRTAFADNTFYDVSAWTLPLAFNLPFSHVNNIPGRQLQALPGSAFTAAANATAYRFAAAGRAAAGLALALLADGVSVYRVTEQQLALGNDSSIQAGDFLVPVLRGVDRAQLESSLNRHQQRWPVAVTAITSGFNLAGADLGSPSVKPLRAVRPAMLVGRGVVPMEAGHTWHLVDRHLQLPLSMLDIDMPAPPDLNSYTHLLIPNAGYNTIPASWRTLIRSWVNNGGVLIAQKQSALWAEAVFSPASETEKADKLTGNQRFEKRLERLTSIKDHSQEQLGQRRYVDFQKDAAERVLGGAIFEATIDQTHPLAMGYEQANMPVFLNSLTILSTGHNAYTTVVRLDTAEPLAGYASDYVKEALQQAPLIVADKVGKGQVIKLAFNPNFRAFWQGTEQLYINALLNGHLIGATVLPR